MITRRKTRTERRRKKRKEIFMRDGGSCFWCGIQCRLIGPENGSDIHIMSFKFQIKTRFNGVTLFECELDASYESKPDGVKLGAAIREAITVRADLSGANLSGADLSGADLHCADLSRANLSGADLHGVYLSGADLHCADLSRANLHGANLHGADLHGADLRGADLHGVYLDGVDLDGADFSGADLNGAKIVGLIARVWRISDPYEFFAFETDRGTIIRAGCRTMSPEEYRDHIDSDYPDTDKAEETLAIINFIEARTASLARWARRA